MTVNTRDFNRTYGSGSTAAWTALLEQLSEAVGLDIRRDGSDLRARADCPDSAAEARRRLEAEVR